METHLQWPWWFGNSIRALQRGLSLWLLRNKEFGISFPPLLLYWSFQIYPIVFVHGRSGFLAFASLAYSLCLTVWRVLLRKLVEIFMNLKDLGQLHRMESSERWNLLGWAFLHVSAQEIMKIKVFYAWHEQEKSPRICWQDQSLTFNPRNNLLFFCIPAICQDASFGPPMAIFWHYIKLFRSICVIWKMNITCLIRLLLSSLKWTSLLLIVVSTTAQMIKKLRMCLLIFPSKVSLWQFLLLFRR